MSDGHNKPGEKEHKDDHGHDPNHGQESGHSSKSKEKGVLENIQAKINGIIDGIKSAVNKVIDFGSHWIGKFWDSLEGKHEQSHTSETHEPVKEQASIPEAKPVSKPEVKTDPKSEPKKEAPKEPDKKDQPKESAEKLLAGKINIKKGDITEEQVEAIVNAANTELKLGTGVAGAIKQKGGEAVQQECDKITENGKKKLALGDVTITSGGKLSPKILHAAVMDLGGKATAENLKKAAKNIIEQAKKNNLKVISIPALGAGAGGLKPEESAKAIREGLLESKNTNDIIQINLVVFDDETKKAFETVFKDLTSTTEHQ